MKTYRQASSIDLRAEGRPRLRPPRFRTVHKRLVRAQRVILKSVYSPV